MLTGTSPAETTENPSHEGEGAFIPNPSGGIFDPEPKPGEPAKEEGKESGGDGSVPAQPQSEVTGTEKPAEGEEGKPPAPETEPPKLLAGQFKEVPHLEAAYIQSSDEGRRLKTMNRAAEKKIAVLESELQALKIQAEAGSFKEISKEELAEMSPEDRADYTTRKYLFEDRKTRLEESRKRESQDREYRAQAFMANMMEDEKNFPYVKELIPEMDALIAKVPNLESQMDDKLIHIFYLATLGNKHLQLESERAAKAIAAKEEAAKKAAAAIAGTGKVGGPGKVNSPPTPKTEPDDFNTGVISTIRQSVF